MLVNVSIGEVGNPTISDVENLTKLIISEVGKSGYFDYGNLRKLVFSDKLLQLQKTTMHGLKITVTKGGMNR